MLLKNPAGQLPLAMGKKTAVIGPHAHAQRQLLGSYFEMACPMPKTCPRKRDPSTAHGCPHGSGNTPCPDPADKDFCMLEWDCVSSVFTEIQAVGGGATTSASGCTNGVDCPDTSLFADALAVAKAADQVGHVLR